MLYDHSNAIRDPYRERMLLSTARSSAARLVKALEDRPEVRQIVYAGSACRGVETVGDIDLVGTSKDPEATMNAFTKLPSVAQVLLKTESWTRVRLANSQQCDLRLGLPGDFGRLRHHFTGSTAHNIRLREVAEREGLKIDEHGVSRGENAIFIGDDENAIYEALGMAPIPAELREDRGEIEAALAGSLPRLITQSDIRGDLHAHTIASDGKNTIEEMALKARERGYEYLAITDHSLSRGEHGLSPARLKWQIRAIREAGDRFGIHLLAGSEVDIRFDGSLDYPDELLADLDFVIASVHPGFIRRASR
ncbi:MAG TPA: PHP domain-containing protein [Capsulimonadaceae bacterium]|nr:PHP domain-containing protein [Capsulimonadaceae bacterium]